MTDSRLAWRAGTRRALAHCDLKAYSGQSFGVKRMTRYVWENQIDVRAMCAIGLSGQLGLDGRLPWEGVQEPPFQRDVERFFELTRGHVLMAGERTLASVPERCRENLTLVELHSHMDPKEMLRSYRSRRIFIGGGPPIWAAYAPYIRTWDVTRLPYDGPADRWFDPAWLTAAVASARGQAQDRSV